MKKRVAIYTRVSTKDQTCENQLLDLKRYVSMREGWEIFGDPYIEPGVSGSRDRRPELDRLMADARKRKIDVILVWKLDRFGRSMRHLVTTLEELTVLGIEFVSYQDGLDATTPAGKMMFGVIAAFAEFERNMIRERVLACRRRWEDDVKNGRKRKPWGRPRGARSKKSLTLNGDNIVLLRSQGKSIRAISKETGISKSSIQRILLREENDRQAVS